jgi:putative transposase
MAASVHLQKEWFTAAELATEIAPLPTKDVPRTERGIRAMAQREQWRSRSREGRGGGQEYHLSSLPLTLQAALVVKQNVSASTPTPAPVAASPEALWSHWERLPATVKAEAQGRLATLTAVECLTAGGTTKTRAVELIAAERGLAPRTVAYWFGQVRDVARADWLPALAPRYVGGQRQADCSPEAWDHFVADYLRNSEPSAESCYRRLERAARERGWTVPSLKTLMRRVEREVPQNVVILKRKGEHALTRFYPAQQRDHSVFQALEAVTADGHRFDVFVDFGDGRIGRPILLAFQDIYSGKLLSWRLAVEPTAELVRLTLVDLVTDWGVPRAAWLDNDRIFASKWITGGTSNRYRFKVRDTDPDGVLTTLGIQVHWATPYWGQAKPIERAFRDLCDDVSKHPVCEGAYTGNSPVNKPANYGSTAVSFAEFEVLVAQQIEAHNARPGRRSLVCGGVKSFDQVFLESWSAACPRRITTEQRRMMLLAAEGVTADRQNGGRIEIFGNRYWAEPLLRFAGKRLVVRFDPNHLDQPLHVYTLDGRYICDAPCQELAGFDDVAAAKAHSRARRDFIRATKQQADAVARIEALDPSLRITRPAATEPPTPAAVSLVPARRRRTGGNEALALTPDETLDPAEVTRLIDRGMQRLRLVED